MKKFAVIFLVGLIAMMPLFAAAQAEVVAQPKVEATFAHIFQPGHTLSTMAESFVEKASAATDGRVSIKLVPAGALGGMDSNLEGLSLGTVDITLVGESYTSRYYPPMGVSTAPYAFQSWNHFRNYVKSDLFKGFKDEFKKVTGNIIIGTFTSGFRSVTANKPVRKPSDMVGLKIRVPDAPAFTAMPKAAGASPTPIAFAEVYLALQQKVVDAQENPLETTFNMKFYEVSKYICLTEHMMEPAHIIVSSKFWDKLSDADKQALILIAEEVSAVATDAAETASSKLAGEFTKLGSTVVTDVDKKAFADICVPFNTSSERGWTASQFQELQSLTK